MTSEQSNNGTTAPQERELYVVLSDKNAVSALALTWIVLLVALIVTQVRYRRLKNELAELGG